MTQLFIVTTPQNSGDGTPLATAFNYTNSNFSELYARVQTSPPATLTGTTGDQAGMYAYDPTYFYYCFADYTGNSTIWGQVTQVANIAVSAISDGTSNVKLVGLNGDATININGVGNIAAFRTTGAYITGLISATGNVTGSNVTGANVIGTRVVGGNVSATGDITANNAILTGSLTTGNGLLTTNAYPGTFSDGIVVDYVTGNGRISVGSTDAITFYNNGVGNVAIVSFDPQGNIVTGGTFNSTGNILTQGIVSATGNIETSGYFVGTFVGNVTGNFVVPGSNTQVIFNTSGNADAVGGFTYNKDSNTMIVLGIVSGQGNIIGGNIKTAGQVSATGNIVGSNLTGTNISGTLTTVSQNNITSVGTLSSLSVTANIQSGNLRTSGVLSATGNIKGGNLSITDVEAGGNISSTNYTGTSVSVVGNITGGNINTGSSISATGNITGNYILGNGRQLTGIISSYGNSNVTTLLSGLGSNTISTTGTITSGDITGANILTGGLISSTGNITGGNISVTKYTGTTLSITGTVTAASTVGGVMTGSSISVTGAVTGTNIEGTVYTNSIINTGSNASGNIGSSIGYFNTVFAQATTALYADLAECYLADDAYAPGTVLSFGGNAEVTISNADADVLIVGVVSTNPAYKMNSGLTGDHVVAVALTGRVPCRVQGPVTRGAMMVSAGTGRARAEANPAMGTVIGKAVESFTGDIGTIEIVVGRL